MKDILNRLKTIAGFKQSRLGESASKKTTYIIVPLQEIIVPLLIIVFLFNQFMLTSVAMTMGMSSPNGIFASLVGMQGSGSKMIMAPKLNPDGLTTSLFAWPTITDVAANPHSGDALADAKVVTLATGKPFYAPQDISFDDPLTAQKEWGAMVTSVKLTTEQETRYQQLISLMTCSYCCGSPSQVTLNKNCGCAHANAVRGFYRYMIQNYGAKYSNDQLIGESQRWYALWYPKGMIEDYLLATGNQSALPHETHGGAGTDGMHGLASK